MAQTHQKWGDEVLKFPPIMHNWLLWIVLFSKRSGTAGDTCRLLPECRRRYCAERRCPSTRQCRRSSRRCRRWRGWTEWWRRWRHWKSKLEKFGADFDILFSKFENKSNGLRLSYYFLSLCTYLLPYLKNPASFCLFSFFSHDKYRTNFTINGKSTDGVLGTQTQGGRMVSVGADKSAELWRHPCVLSSFMSFQLLLCPIPRNF